MLVELCMARRVKRCYNGITRELLEKKALKIFISSFSYSACTVTFLLFDLSKQLI